MADRKTALIEARQALHRACLQIGSTEGYRDDFAAINAALNEPHPGDNSEADRLYLLLALFDRRDGSVLADLVRSAREGYKRCGFEPDAWDEFDRLWDSMDSVQRGRLRFAPFEETGRFGPRR